MRIDKEPKLSINKDGRLLVENGRFEREEGDASVGEEIIKWAIREANERLKR